MDIEIQKRLEKLEKTVDEDRMSRMQPTTIRVAKDVIRRIERKGVCNL